jgi:hypothetical protein
MGCWSILESALLEHSAQPGLLSISDGGVDALRDESG